jgi:hypothetical protein
MLAKVLNYLRKRGLRSTLAYVFARLQFFLSPPETPGDLRSRLATSLSHDLNHTVISGLFQGLLMQPTTTWGTGDRASHLLGTYEQEVQSIIAANAGLYDCLIDVGAADGYYAVGCIAKQLFLHCHAFESVERSRSNIVHLSMLNGVADYITIHGTATHDALLQLPISCAASAFVLVDIEGGEFELLSSRLIRHFSSAFFVIELHPATRPDGERAVAQLRERFLATHLTWTIGQGPRDPSQFECLRHLHDNERWLLVSENRGQWMEWLIAKPLAL